MWLLVGSIAASWTDVAPAAPAGTFCSCHVWPLSVDRHKPTGPTPFGVSHVAIVPLSKNPNVVDAQSVVSFAEPAVAGSTRIFETALPTNGPALPNELPPPPSSVQCLPPSSERRMP